MAGKDRHDAYDPEGTRKAVNTYSAAARRPRPGARRGLDARSQEAIGRTLKAHFDDLVRAPIPGRFMELLDRLESNEQAPHSTDRHNE
jgi:hypothetical protein